ncbi:hypothetical protein BABINDRAFT_9160 [Babjeviella inositovora NRRL Y-12698]|uniref:DUF2433 domain-containing protein n=1 Tax=Babjeviella inositovora NRRL Y-12698 TaxID=984486 RepID=A0A1E3QMY4_9ASCO|nr:uncharacterized protein BABINDRAFT_9160 [Babjeviella inositovora NRRL Y-12698]ODQ78357.1 hypothetical protein BABINDRAFT_9160 [Babjeviella inositovora NRRL Y-12698]
MLDPFIRLQTSIVNGNLLIVKKIVSRFPELLGTMDHTNGWSALHYAAYHGNYLICHHLVMAMLAQGYLDEETSLEDEPREVLFDFQRNTPLHLSITKLNQKNSQTMHFLLQQFPQIINLQNLGGQTAVHLAATHGLDDMLSLLLDFQADLLLVELQDGDTPLHLCCKYGHLNCINQILTRTPAPGQIHTDLTEVKNTKGWVPQDVCFDFDVERYYVSLKTRYGQIQRDAVFEAKRLVSTSSLKSLDLFDTSPSKSNLANPLFASAKSRSAASSLPTITLSRQRRSSSNSSQSGFSFTVKRPPPLESPQEHHTLGDSGNGMTLLENCEAKGIRTRYVSPQKMADVPLRTLLGSVVESLRARLGSTRENPLRKVSTVDTPLRSLLITGVTKESPLRKAPEGVDSRTSSSDTLNSAKSGGSAQSVVSAFSSIPILKSLKLKKKKSGVFDEEPRSKMSTRSFRSFSEESKRYNSPESVSSFQTNNRSRAPSFGVNLLPQVSHELSGIPDLAAPLTSATPPSGLPAFNRVNKSPQEKFIPYASPNSSSSSLISLNRGLASVSNAERVLRPQSSLKDLRMKSSNNLKMFQSLGAGSTEHVDFPGASRKSSDGDVSFSVLSEYNPRTPGSSFDYGEPSLSVTPVQSRVLDIPIETLARSRTRNEGLQYRLLTHQGVRILFVAELRGQLSLLNELAVANNAAVIVHSGNFGFFDADSVVRMSEVYLRHIAAFSRLIDAETVARVSAASSVHEILAHQQLSELPRYILGEKRLRIPVYTIYGMAEDSVVVNKFRYGEYRVPNLYVIDEHNAYKLLTPDCTCLTLCGLGGGFSLYSLLNQGEGYPHETALIPAAGDAGNMWHTLVQYGVLIETMEREAQVHHIEMTRALNGTVSNGEISEGNHGAGGMNTNHVGNGSADRSFPDRADSPVEVRLFITHPSPAREPLLGHLAVALGADYTVSSSLHFKYPSSFNELSVCSSFEAYKQKFSTAKTQLYVLWQSVLASVEASIEEPVKGLLETALLVFDNIPSLEPESLSQAVLKISVTDQNDLYYAAFQNTWHFNLCDHTSGKVVMEVKDGRFHVETLASGFDFTYRRKWEAPVDEINQF